MGSIPASAEMLDLLEQGILPVERSADYDALVSRLPTCQSLDNPPRHQPINSGDYLVSRFRTV